MAIVKRSPDPLKFDPSRTLGLRRSFAAEFVRRLELLRGDVVRLLIVEDAFSLDDPTYNFNPNHDPNDGRFSSGGGVAVKGNVDELASHGDYPATYEMKKQVFLNTGISAKTVHKVLGVPEDADITIRYWSNFEEFHSAEVTVRGKDGKAGKYDMEREYRSKGKEKWITNRNFEVENKGTGFGVDVLHKQVQQAASLGYDYIETTAAGFRGGEMNGYYTWPRLGFDGDFQFMSDVNIKREAHEKFGAFRVSDVMKTKEGREWWKKRGGGFDATFDLKEGSLSRKVLDAYVQEKKNRTAPTTNEGGRRDTRLGVGLVSNVQWKFATTEQQVRAFQSWLDEQIKRRLLTTDEVDRIWTQRYINAAYKKGIIRGETQTARLRRKQFTSFLRDTAKQRRKTELLVRRSLNDVEGLANRVKTNAARIVADGLANGKTKRQIAKELSDQLGIEKNRARTIARTEVVRAQAEGQLDSFEAEGVTHVGALVEWVTRAGRGASEAEMQAAGVCPKCQAMSGVVLSLEEARGLIPRHPNCYCAWFPALDTPDPDEKRSKLQIQRAISRSSQKDKGKGWAGTQKQFKSKTRKARKRR